MTDIVFLLTHIPNPRMNKRIALAKGIGSCAVVCARRKNNDVFNIENKDVDHIILEIDIPPASNVAKRIPYTMKFLRTVKSELTRLAPRVIYADGMDSLLAIESYKKKHKDVKVIFEIADVRELFLEENKSLIATAVKKEEERLLKYIDTLVVTSEKFIEQRYGRFFEKRQWLFMPNMPDLTAFNGYKRKSGGDFTVGFIGGMRYPKQMMLLIDAANDANVKLFFAGGNSAGSVFEDLEEYARGKGDAEFFGKYNYNNQIASLYGKVDVVYAVYDADNSNVRIALPNKLYESVYCGLPIIVANGTYLSEIVSEWGVGVSVAHNDKEALCEILKKLRNDAAFTDAIRAACDKKRPDMDKTIYEQRLKERIKEYLEN